MRPELPSEGALRSIIGWVATGAFDLFPTRRIEEKCSVALRPGMLAFDPDRATLGDLMVAAALLERGQNGELSTAGTNHPDPAEVARAYQVARQEIARQFPRLPLPGKDELPPQVKAKSVKLDPLDVADFAHCEVSARDTGSADIEGAEGDGERIADLIREGRVKERACELCPDLSIVDLEVTSGWPPLSEHNEHLLRVEMEKADDLAEAIASCVRDRANDNAMDAFRPDYARFGSELAASRLHDAYLASLTGATPAVFRTDRMDEDWFDPRRALSIVHLDLERFSPGKGKRLPKFAGLGVPMAYQKLGVPMELLVFEHRVIRRELRPQHVVVHIVHRLCAAGDPVDEHVLSRLLELLKRAGSGDLGQLASLPHLQDDTALKVLHKKTEELDPREIWLTRAAGNNFEPLSNEIQVCLDRDLEGRKDRLEALEEDLKPRRFDFSNI